MQIIRPNSLTSNVYRLLCFLAQVRSHACFHFHKMEWQYLSYPVKYFGHCMIQSSLGNSIHCVNKTNPLNQRDFHVGCFCHGVPETSEDSLLHKQESTSHRVKITQVELIRPECEGRGRELYACKTIKQKIRMIYTCIFLKAWVWTWKHCTSAWTSVSTSTKMLAAIQLRSYQHDSWWDTESI